MAERRRPRSEVPLPPTRRKLKKLVRRRGKVGRKKLSVQEDRKMFVRSLVASRLSYPEIAKAFAKKFHLTLKGAYLYLNRLNASAVRALEDYDDRTLMLEFQRMVLSLEDVIMRAKLAEPADLKTAVQGEMALARIYGFDKGAFLAALQERRKTAREVEAKVIDTSVSTTTRALLAKDMHALSVKQLQNLLTDDAVSDLIGEGESGEVSGQRKTKKTAEAEIVEGG